MAEDTGAATEHSKDDPPPQNPKPDNVGCFSGMSCFVMFWLVGYFVLGGAAMYLVMTLAALIAAAFLILTHIARACGWLSPKWVRFNHGLAVAFTIAAPFLYHGYKSAVENLYVIPTGEYNTNVESRTRWSRQYFESMEKEGRLSPEDRRHYYENMHRHINETKTVHLDGEATFQIDSDHPRLDGATSLAGIYRSFAQAAYKGGYDRESLVRCSRTPYAYEDLINGKADMIFVFRPSEKQIQAAAEKGIEFKITPIGYDAFVFFVNAKNPVAGLTMEQLKGIYSGKITRWNEVGGIAWKIVPFQRSEGSGSQSRMLQFMGETPLLPAEEETLFVSMMNIVHTARYHNYRGAIGYSFLYFVDQMILAQGIKLLKIDGVPPTLDSIRDGTYPLTEEICAVTAGSDNPNVEPFIEWMLSPQGQGLVEKVGYIPINTPAAPKAGQAEK